jgi:hypothetical protein
VRSQWVPSRRNLEVSGFAKKTAERRKAPEGQSQQAVLHEIRRRITASVTLPKGVGKHSRGHHDVLSPSPSFGRGHRDFSRPAITVTGCFPGINHRVHCEPTGRIGIRGMQRKEKSGLRNR